MATASPRVTQTKPRSSLTKLAAQINQEHAAFEQSLKRGLEHARHAGELLNEAKNRVAHGEWLPWLKKNCKVIEWSAQAYMRVAQRYQELSKSGTVTDLTLRDGLKQLAGTRQEQDGNYRASVMVSAPPAETTRKVTVQVCEPTIRKAVIPAYYTQPQPLMQPQTPAPVVTVTEPETADEMSRMSEQEFKTALAELCRGYERDNNARLDTLQVVRDGAGLIREIDLWPAD